MSGGELANDHDPRATLCNTLQHFLVILTPYIIYLLLFSIAALADSAVADAVHDHGIAAALRRHPSLLAIWKAPGDFWFTTAVAVLGLAFGLWRRRAAMFLLVAGAISGWNVIPKWIMGRTRPFKLAHETAARPFELHPFRGGWYGFFHQQNLSFPSGHECTAATLALTMMVIRPRAALFWGILAAAVGMERVLENAHYCSDVIGALPVALVSVALAGKLVHPDKSRVETGGSDPALNR